MPANLLTVKDRVQRYLTDFVGRVELDPDGDFTFRFGSARMFVRVRPLGDENTVVDITAPVVLNARRSPELFHYVATEGSYTFGHLSAHERDGGVGILYGHSLLGDFLDPDELRWAIGAMARTADEVDTELKARFGGDTFHEDE